jgi:hypothetical protein
MDSHKGMGNFVFQAQIADTETSLIYAVVLLEGGLWMGLFRKFIIKSDWR